jgi:hypothetical protein
MKTDVSAMLCLIEDAEKVKKYDTLEVLASRTLGSGSREQPIREQRSNAFNIMVTRSLGGCN